MKLNNTLHKISFPGFFQFIRHPADFLQSGTERYGENFTVQFPDRKIFTFVSNPQSLECLATAPPETFDFSESMAMFSSLVRDNSLLQLEGNMHVSHRKLLQPPFHGERMKLYGELICQLTEGITKSWSIGNSIELLPTMQQITLDVLLNVVFGSSQEGCLKQIHEKATELIVRFVTSRLFPFLIFVPILRQDWGKWTMWGRFQRLLIEFDRLVCAEIARRRENPDPEATDILSMLVASRYDDGQPMSSQEICDELFTLLLTGYDTTSMVLVWAMYWIHQLPRVRASLLDEFKTIDNPLDTKAIAKLPYLTATCKETLRLYPSLLGFLRVPRKPFDMLGYECPAGSEILGNIYSAHRRQEVYSDPSEFRPERFLDRKYSPYEYLPFGGGNRVCIGKAFAEFQMKLILFTILSKYQLELPNDNPLHLNTVRRAAGVMPSKNVRLQVTALCKRESSVVVS